MLFYGYLLMAVGTLGATVLNVIDGDTLASAIWAFNFALWVMNAIAEKLLD